MAMDEDLILSCGYAIPMLKFQNKNEFDRAQMICEGLDWSPLPDRWSFVYELRTIQNKNRS
jgi:hypothetical protein